METAFDVSCLDKLETLKCSWSLASHNFLDHLTLVKLVGLLPNLEILKLQKNDFVGVNSPEWETVEGDFLHLVSLKMLDLNLVYWKTKATHLPKLKHLVILNCYAMVEIPLDIGNIHELELIQVCKSSPSALVSALRIKEDQEGLGNKFLKTRTHKVI